MFSADEIKKLILIEIVLITRWICKKIEEFFEFAAVAGQELRLTFKANWRVESKDQQYPNTWNIPKRWPYHLNNIQNGV